MSQGAFNQVLIQSVIERARKTMLSMGTQIINTGTKIDLRSDSPLNLEQIRIETNPASKGYQTVITRGGLQGLAQSFSAYAEESDNYRQAGELLNRQELYDNFKTFILNKYKDQTKRASKTRNYSYDTIKTSTGDIRIGTKLGLEDESRSSEEDLIIFKNLDHGKFKPIFIDFLQKHTSASTELLQFINKNLDAGHLAGVFDIKYRRIFNLQVSESKARESSYRDFKVSAANDEQLNNFFNRILLLIHDADYVSSNIVYDTKLFTSMVKDIHRPKQNHSVSAELQLSRLNAAAGTALAAIGKQLNNLIKAVDSSKSRTDLVAARQAVEGMIKNLNSVVQIIEKTVSNLNNLEFSPEVKARLQQILADTKATKTYLTAEGSPNIVTATAQSIAAALSNKKLKSQITKATNSTKITIKTGKKAKTPAPQIKKPQAVQKTKVSTVKQEQAVSKISPLISLQNLLNLKLVETVKQNMGAGDRRDILNLRSGRFAESVRVDRLTESRQGMITAFYTYMRNPYATFSRGGNQERPFTRDPKLLIARSIRQVAEQIVGNRLRAVLV